MSSETARSPITVQLRRYQIEPGRLADHVAWFPTICAARRQHGFRVLFAFADEEHSIFTWAVAVDGDMDRFIAVDKVYSDSPERASAFDTNPKVVTSLELAFVVDALAG